jgi:hypothetical protein
VIRGGSNVGRWQVDVVDQWMKRLLEASVGGCGGPIVVVVGVKLNYLVQVNGHQPKVDFEVGSRVRAT